MGWIHLGSVDAENLLEQKKRGAAKSRNTFPRFFAAPHSFGRCYCAVAACSARRSMAGQVDGRLLYT